MAGGGAQRAGTSPKKYLYERLRKEQELPLHFPSVADEEAHLLAKITRESPEDFWARYRLLTVQREARTITEDERQNLIHLAMIEMTKIDIAATEAAYPG